MYYTDFYKLAVTQCIWLKARTLLVEANFLSKTVQLSNKTYNVYLLNPLYILQELASRNAVQLSHPFLNKAKRITKLFYTISKIISIPVEVRLFNKKKYRWGKVLR